MSDSLNAQRSLAPSAPPAPIDEPDAPVVPGPALRVDAPHTFFDAESARQAGDGLAASARRYVATAASESGLELPTDGGTPHVLQTSQIASHLRQQHAELDRREQRLHAQLAQFDQERREMRMFAADLEAGLQEREFGIERQEAALAQRAEACLKLEAELKQLHESLLRERHSLNAEREQFVVDRERDRQELDELQIRRGHELEIRHQDFLAEQEQLRLQLQQERVLLDNRHRFQQEHLRKSMQEFEVVQAEFRREQQVGRTRLDETEQQNLLRNRQLVRVRELVEERQHSVERERELLSKERRSLEERLQHDRTAFEQEREGWQHERDVQRADLRRQQDLLALHAENLETRRQRLDRLRSELEETNRQTLELRLAVEESYAQLTQTAGAEPTQRRIEEARSVLAEYYRHTRDSLWQQRQDLDQAQTKLDRQRDEFQHERQALVEWVGGRETELDLRDQTLRQKEAEQEARDRTWQAAADRWMQEKLQAESVIRDLLRQLAEREDAKPAQPHGT